MEDQMTHQEWLDWRRAGLGASDAPIIMEVSPWTSKYQLWEDKVLGKGRADNANMKFGRDTEDEAREAFQIYADIEVFPCRKLLENNEWLRCTLDGLDPDKKVMVEIKCANEKDHFTASTNKVPKHYYPQCQHQMLVVGLDEMYYWSYYKGQGVPVKVKRDEDYIKDLFEKSKDFWFNNVLLRKPPFLSELDHLDMENDKSWEMLCRRYENICEDIRVLEEEKTNTKRDIVEHCKEMNAKGKGYRLMKCTKKGSVDLERLLNDHPDIDIEMYKKNSFTYWDIRNIKKA